MYFKKEEETFSIFKAPCVLLKLLRKGPEFKNPDAATLYCTPVWGNVLKSAKGSGLEATAI